MSTFNCRPEDLAKLIGTHEGARRAAVMDGVEIAAHRALVEVVRHTPVDEGWARKGWVVHRTPSGVELRNDTVHAEILESGRRPGQAPPPLAPILAWVERHQVELGVGRKRSHLLSEKRLGPTGQGSVVDEGLKDLFQTAQSIRFAIGRRGQKPKRIVASRLSTFARWAAEEARAELERVG